MFRKFEYSPYEFLQDNALIYDIGSKDIVGREYVFGKPPDNTQVVCVDIEPRLGVDIVADAHDLFMVEDSSVDCVVTVSTLGACTLPTKNDERNLPNTPSRWICICKRPVHFSI